MPSPGQTHASTDAMLPCRMRGVLQIKQTDWYSVRMAPYETGPHLENGNQAGTHDPAASLTLVRHCWLAIAMPAGWHV